MTIAEILKNFQGRVYQSIRLQQAGPNRYRILTPFIFDDGDHLKIVLKRPVKDWLLTDEGHTFMRLTYDLSERDLRTEARQEIISDALKAFSVEDRDRELVMSVPEDQFGDALYSFVQAILKISDVTFLTQERVQTTFLQDFRAFMEETIPEERRQFNWHEASRDPKGNYAVDCRVNGTVRPLHVFALKTDTRTRDATIALLKFELWGLSFRSLGIFENVETISTKVCARFMDVCDRQFSGLTANRDRILSHFAEYFSHDT